MSSTYPGANNERLAEEARMPLLCRKCGVINNVRTRLVAEGKRPMCGRCGALLVNKTDFRDLQIEAKLALAPFTTSGDNSSKEEVVGAVMEELRKHVVWD